MRNSRLKHKVIDYLFWIIFILYSNPGGILEAIGLKKEGESSLIRDFFFLLLFSCFMLVFYKFKNKSQSFRKIIIYLLFFSLYYFMVFGYFTPIFKETPGYSFVKFLVKNRHTVYSFLLFVMVYIFYLRSNILFFRYLVISSIFILILFIFGIISGVELLPISKASRGFVKMDRIFLMSYGFMPLLIPIGVVILVFIKKNFKWKKLFIIAFGLMFLAWLLSITRRHIFGTFIYMALAIIIFNYIEHKSFFSIKKYLSVLFYVLIISFVMFLSFPKYISAGISAVGEVVSVIGEGETSGGNKDTRLGFGKKFMQDIIIQNPFFGTGFDNRWRTKEGDTQGYEATDYPLLGAIAMTGIFGILFFLPIYIILIRSLIFDIKFLRRNNVNYYSIEFFGLILFILYFVYNLILYMNWFSPVSLTGKSSWYIYLGMYFASRQLFYSSSVSHVKYEK